MRNVRHMSWHSALTEQLGARLHSQSMALPRSLRMHNQPVNIQAIEARHAVPHSLHMLSQSLLQWPHRSVCRGQKDAHAQDAVSHRSALSVVLSKKSAL